MAAPLVQTEGLSKRFGGVHALRDAAISIGQGEHVGLVGDNGAGKSTFVKILTGAMAPDSGSIWIEGKEASFRGPQDARNRGIETVYQDLAIANNLDVVANLFLGRERLRMRFGPLSVLDKRGMKREAEALLAGTGVKIPNLRSLVGTLSGGQRQGVAIARAVGWGSKIVVMDEPTAALGVQETARVEGTIRRLREQGVSLLLVSHNIRQVLELVDTVWVFRHGRVVASLSAHATSGEKIVASITGADTVGSWSSGRVVPGD